MTGHRCRINPKIEIFWETPDFSTDEASGDGVALVAIHLRDPVVFHRDFQTARVGTVQWAMLMYRRHPRQDGIDGLTTQFTSGRRLTVGWNRVEICGAAGL